MEQAIRDFPKQFAWQPEMKNQQSWPGAKKFVVCGMGGSNLASEVLKSLIPELDMIVHRDYGLPETTDLGERLIILSSYSGNTEETLDSYSAGRKQGLNLLVISTGGKLTQAAKQDQVSYIEMPTTGIQPRMALGFQIRGLLLALGEEQLLTQTSELAENLNTEQSEQTGQELAKSLQSKVPIVYAASRNSALAYNWKIKFNETGKIPAFYNVLPELNHNEMTGFDVKTASRSLSEKFHFIFLRDQQDHPRIQKRMTILQKLYQDRGLPVLELELQGKNRWQKIFQSLILADWTALYTAKAYRLEPEQVPMVEEFKKLMEG